MSSYNKIILMGRITRDPELKYAQSGTVICKFDLAVNTKSGSGDNHKEEVLFIRIATFGKTAENCGQYLKKGQMVLVDGRLKTDTVESDDGTKKYFTEVAANAVQFMPKGVSQPAEVDTGSVGNNIDDGLEDCPF